MIATVHMLAGASAGVKSKSIFLALFAGLLSHYILDAVPHLDAINAIHAWNIHSWSLIILDIIIGAIVGMYFWIRHHEFPKISMFTLGAVGGLLPDILDSQPFWAEAIGRLPVLGKIQLFHHFMNGFPVQYFPMPQWAILGIITQILVVMISLKILTTPNVK